MAATRFFGVAPISSHPCPVPGVVAMSLLQPLIENHVMVGEADEDTIEEPGGKQDVVSCGKGIGAGA
jgi:hypothetical protein